MTIEREILLTVGGMNCAGCARGIEVILKSQPGVTEARVNFATHEARVVFAPPKDPQLLVDAIRKGGYQAELPIDPTEDPFLLAAKKDHDEAQSLFFRATVAAVLGVALLVITSGSTLFRLGSCKPWRQPSKALASLWTGSPQKSLK